LDSAAVGGRRSEGHSDLPFAIDGGSKHQIPKHQAPEKSQTPSPKSLSCAIALELEIWNLSGAGTRPSACCSMEETFLVQRKMDEIEFVLGYWPSKHYIRSFLRAWCLGLGALVRAAFHRKQRGTDLIYPRSKS